MIVYQVNVKVDATIRTDWMYYMKSEHIPDVIKTNLFFNAVLLEDTEEKNLFSILYFCDNEDVMQEYLSKHASRLRHEHTVKFQGKFTATRKIFTLEKEFPL